MARNLMTLTPDLIFAAGRDAANRQMRAAGRAKWSRSDARVACITVNQLTLKYGSPMEQMAARECLRRTGARAAA